MRIHRLAYAGHTITTLLCSDLNPNANDCAYAESNDILLNYYLMPYKWPTLTLYRNRIPGTYAIRTSIFSDSCGQHTFIGETSYGSEVLEPVPEL